MFLEHSGCRNRRRPWASLQHKLRHTECACYFATRSISPFPPANAALAEHKTTLRRPSRNADFSYCYPIGTRIIMADGNVLPVEYLKPGMHFRLEDGGTATATGVQQPKLWEPLSQQRDGNGNAVRRIVGTVKYTGIYPRVDLVVAGETIKTTPSHLFYSAERRAWVPAETLRRGELLCNPQRIRLPIELFSEIYFERGSLSNVEVEDPTGKVIPLKLPKVPLST